MGTVSVRDVAARALVSPGTVSNYFRHPQKLSRETAERIRVAIDELGYIGGNPAARALRLGESLTIAHLTFEVGNPFFADFSHGVQERASEFGYEVLIANSAGSGDREAWFLDLFEAQRVRGILLSPLEDLTDRLTALRSTGMPVALIDAHAPGIDVASVSVDDVLGGRLAVQHLLTTGRRRLLFVGGPLSIDSIADRLEGARQALAGTGASLSVLETEDRTIARGRAVGATLADGTELTDGIFAANDLLAVGLLHGLLAAGVKVPEALAIVGYDDIDFAADAIVPLTTVRRPAFEFGRTALDVLHRVIVDDTAEHVQFPPELIVRDSTLALD